MSRSGLRPCSIDLQPLPSTVRTIEAIAPQVIERVIGGLWRDDPFWQARFGDRGRRHADEDLGHHLRFLGEAIRAGDPAMFAAYARWLQRLLLVRGMCTLHIVDTFERLGEALADLTPEVSDDAQPVLTAGLAALHDRPGPAAALGDDSRALGRAIFADCEDLPLVAPLARWQAAPLVSFLSDSVWLHRPEHFASHVAWLCCHLSQLGERRALPYLLNTLDRHARACLGAQAAAAESALDTARALASVCDAHAEARA